MQLKKDADFIKKNIAALQLEKPNKFFLRRCSLAILPHRGSPSLATGDAITKRCPCDAAKNGYPRRCHCDASKNGYKLCLRRYYTQHLEKIENYFCENAPWLYCPIGASSH
jgi:hypothetical protein